MQWRPSAPADGRCSPIANPRIAVKLRLGKVQSLAATPKEGNHVGIHKSNRTRSHRWGTERPAVRGSHTGEGNAGVFGEAKTGPGVTGVSFSSVPC
jgi:hypothetical protein